MYGQPYQFLDVSQLKLMTDLADYYCALPALSHSIYRALAEKKIPMKYHAAELASIGLKLRNKALFRDRITLLAGDWSKDSDEVDRHERGLEAAIQPFVKAVRTKIYVRITKSHSTLFLVTSNYTEVKSCIARLEFRNENEPGPRLPWFYRAVYADGYGGEREYQEMVREIVGPLLVSKLVFERDGLRPGKDLYDHHFLCATVEDDEIPWDQTQADW